MKHHDCFLRTQALITGQSRYLYRVSVNLNMEKIHEILPTAREEAKECTVYLEQLFKSPRIERNMRKITQHIQQTLEHLLGACDIVADAESSPGPQIRNLFGNEDVPEHCREVMVVLDAVLELLVDLFFKFIDQDTRMPRTYYEARAASFAQTWDSMMADKHLPEAVTEEMNWLKAPFDFDESGVPRRRMSYRDIYELEYTMLHTMDTVYADLPEDVQVARLRAHFWNFNFNLPAYAKTVFRREIQPLAALPLEDQLTGIVKIINRVRQRKRATDIGLSHTAHLKDAVMGLLTAHLDGLKLTLNVSRFITDIPVENARPPFVKLTLRTEKLGHLLRYLHEHHILADTDPATLLHFVSVFFQPARGPRYDINQLLAAYHANPVISEHNAKRLLDPKQ